MERCGINKLDIRFSNDDETIVWPCVTLLDSLHKLECAYCNSFYDSIS